LAHKYGRALGSLAVIFVIAVIGYYYTQSKAPTLVAHGHTYQLEVATTTIAQERGLSGRLSMPAKQGMLFSFNGEAQRCFWMKGMRFPLDIIWLNGRKQVVHLERNVSPKTYPETFCPPQLAQYVVELNAGQARIAGITTGETLKF